MESQATTSFQPFAESKAKDIELHNYLAQWKNKHNRNKKAALLPGRAALRLLTKHS